MAPVIFAVLSLLCLGAVAGMIVSRQPAHNALFLVLAFACLGGLFGLLEAPYAAVAQVLVYAGAIMVLFLFAIMMFNLRRPEPPARRGLRTGLAAILAVLLLAELALAAARALGGVPPEASAEAGASALVGRILYTDLLYPLEIAALLVVASLVGALALAGRREGE